MSRRLIAGTIVVLLSGCASLAPDCVPRGEWVEPAANGPRIVAADSILAKAAAGSIVLLGEIHDNAAHHDWQVRTLEALHARRPNLIIGLEMFPRRVQPVLDRWIAGELSLEDFLVQSEWKNIWNFDPKLYTPILEFARERRIPMLALNVDRALVREVGKVGFDAVPESNREGVTKPAAASPAYVDWLFEIFAKHHKPAAGAAPLTREDARFRRFVEAQQTWDRAFAQRLAQSAARADKPLVVGIMGSGHILQGFGVPHQLNDVGARSVTSLIPWPRSDACKDLVSGYADAVFGAW